VFLPILVGKKVVGVKTSQHTTYYLILFVEDFFPFDEITDDSKKQIQDSEKQIQDSKKQIQDSKKQIQDSEKQIQDSEKQIQDSEKQIQDSNN
jgi:peptidoglycan hydrolase CwlO-like protein